MKYVRISSNETMFPTILQDNYSFLSGCPQLKFFVGVPSRRAKSAARAREGLYIKKKSLNGFASEAPKKLKAKPSFRPFGKVKGLRCFTRKEEVNHLNHQKSQEKSPKKSKDPWLQSTCLFLLPSRTLSDGLFIRMGEITRKFRRKKNGLNLANKPNKHKQLQNLFWQTNHQTNYTTST